MITADVAVLSEPLRDSYPPIWVSLILAGVAWSVWGILVAREKKVK